MRFNIGEKVLVRTHRLSSSVNNIIHKFFLLYEGLYGIVSVKQNNAYVVVDPGSREVRGTFNVVFLRKYIPPVYPLVTSLND